MAVALNAVSEVDPDPNNVKTVLERILNWLAPNTAGVDYDPSTILSSRINGVRPNPFNPRAEIAFTLSSTGAAGPVQLDIFDLEGRKVANLFEGQLPAGPHTRTWNGLTDDGTPVRSGVYFSYLTTQEGTVSEKMVLLK
jgi:flagellar hook assembly protein FlgD